MVQDGHQDQHQTVPNKQDFLQTIMSDGRSITLDVWIAIEKLSPAEDENAAKQKDDHGENESDAERRNASLFNHRYHQGTIRFQWQKRIDAFDRFYNACGGFSDATEGGIATPSSEVNARENRASRSRRASAHTSFEE
jgi:hypothetical protein